MKSGHLYTELDPSTIRVYLKAVCVYIYIYIYIYIAI